MLSIKSILWPFDGSEMSQKALDTAVVMAIQFNAKIHGLHVIDSMPTLSITGYGDIQTAGFDIALYEAELRKSARESLEQTVSDRVPKGVEVETIIERGVPKETISDYARDNGIDLIIMSTHGRSGLSRVMLGSVAEATIRTSKVPILVIPSDE